MALPRRRDPALRSGTKLLVFGVALVLGTGGIALFSSAVGSPWHPLADSHGSPVASPVFAPFTLPAVTLLAGYNGSSGAVRTAYANFTIANPNTEVFFLWAAGAVGVPTLPVGLTVAQSWNTSACCASAGVAMGLLGPGNYSTSLFANVTNGYYTSTIAVSVAVYGLADGTVYSYDTAQAPSATSLTMPAGGLAYLAAMSGGGQRPIDSTSLATVDEASPSYSGGFGEELGRQYTNVLSETPEALLYGIAAVGIYPTGSVEAVTFTEVGLPGGTHWSVSFGGENASSASSSIQFGALNGSYPFVVSSAGGYTATPGTGTAVVAGAPLSINVTFQAPPSLVSFLGGYNGFDGAVQTAYANFTIANPNTEVFYLWAAGAVGIPTLPVGLTVTQSWNTSACCASAGVAMGLLGPGAYSTSLFANVTNGYYTSTAAVSVAVYALANGTAYTYDSAQAPLSTNLTLPTGGLTYLAALSSGGQLPIDSTSLAIVDEASPAYLGGQGDEIGRQHSNVLSETPEALLYGIAAVGIYSAGSLHAVTFTETGLPVGTSWSATLNGSVKSSLTNQIVFQALNGSYPFSVSVLHDPNGIYEPSPSSGTAPVHGSGISIPVTFTVLPSLLSFLAGYNGSSGAVRSAHANFTIANPNTEVFYLWAAGAVGVPTLPVGLTVAQSWNTSACCASAGVAMGLLGPGNYSTSLFANVTNGVYNATIAVSVAVYALANGTAYSYDTAQGPLATSLTMPAGGLAYLAAMSSGGQLPIDSTSLAIVDEASPAYLGGHGDEIGRQNANVLSENPEAFLYGIAGVGIFPAGSLGSFNATESGLPNGTHWAMALDGLVKSTPAPSVRYSVTDGRYSYVVGPVPAGPSAVYAPTTSNGTVRVVGGSGSLHVTFALLATNSVTFLARHLPSGLNWSISSGLLTFTNTTGRGLFPGVGIGRISLREPNGLFPFSIHAPPGYGVVRIAGLGAPNLTEGRVAGTTVWTVTFGRLVSLYFNESVLPRFHLLPGAAWRVALTPLLPSGGPAAASAWTNGTSVAFKVPAGAVYRVVVTGPDGAYRALTPSIVAVPGHAATKVVRFQLLTQAVVLREAGLRSGSWSVTISSGSSIALTYPISASNLRDGAIRLLLPVGTFTYSLSATDHQTAPGGTIAVSHAPSPAQNIVVTFV